ncbi:hypothetical protein [Dyadobacter frigoris]|uniref:hypothetical protein n=1 Tax=Dyadobacter frigoris TaxID=2576211 RepID=UPI001484D8EB|nr:hypothetical protein [Dyadobacter frigoris]
MRNYNRIVIANFNRSYENINGLMTEFEVDIWGLGLLVFLVFGFGWFFTRPTAEKAGGRVARRNFCGNL